VAAAVVAAAATAAARDVYLRPRGFFLGPGAVITLPVLAGAFSRSEHGVQRGRVIDLSLWGPAGRRPIDRATWTERGPRSTVRVEVGAPGTYVVGVALGPGTAGRGPRVISAKTLLAVTDATGHLLPAATLRAGSAATAVFGHEAEIVPQVDPYALDVGDRLTVQARLGGRPLAGTRLRAGGTIGTSATPIPDQSPTTGVDGTATIHLTHDGHWYVAFSHARASASAAAVRVVARDATLTFGLLPAGAR
jgi:hypothetical protein